jgi:hypothetical protein
MSAIYCPATLDIIRKYAHRGAKAVAEMLGWPVDRVMSVARKHGIELCAVAAVSIVAPAPEPPPAPAPAADLHLHQWASWARTSCVVKTPLGTVKLRLTAARVFDVLWHARGRLSGAVVASLSGASFSNICVIAHAISDNLRPIGLIVQGQKGSDGGYLLVRTDAQP